MNPDWIYLDNNATTAPLPAVVGAMATALSQTWANASSAHPAGQLAKQALLQARTQVARLLGCKPAQVVFTSGATEANHMVLRALPQRLAAEGRGTLVLSRAEHAGQQKLAHELAHQLAVRWIGLHADGTLNMSEAQALMTADVGLVSVMAANNETGVLMPLANLAEWAHKQGALLHVDATQWIGKLPFDFAQSGADLVSLSAHKFHGPKGVGALIVRAGLDWPALLLGTQERRRRGGTENVPGIVGMGMAAQKLTLTAAEWQDRVQRMQSLRDQLEQGLLARLPGTVVFASSSRGSATDTEPARLPNTVYLRFGRLHADVVLNRLERLGIMASSGSACSAGGNEPSAVLLAMGVPRDEALCAVRFSLSEQTTAAQIESVLARLPAELAPLMSQSTDGVTV